MNEIDMKIPLIIIILLFVFASVYTVFASENLNPASIEITIASAKTLKGIAGDYVTISGQVVNSSDRPINDISTYLSLVDKENKLPVDLEDWSAEKGLYIGTIDAKQSLPLSWKIHLVKAGSYSLAIIADIADEEKPITSLITHFIVEPKKNLNPGQVLPVALGMPILLFAFLAFIQYRRSVMVSD